MKERHRATVIPINAYQRSIARANNYILSKVLDNICKQNQDQNQDNHE